MSPGIHILMVGFMVGVLMPARGVCMPKLIRKLNDAQVRAIKSDGFHAVGGGLYLQVMGEGRSWVFRYQFRGRRRHMGLGGAADVSLKAAREQVEDAKAAIRAGVDPIDKRMAGEVPTFGAFADEFIAEKEKTFRHAKTAYKWRLALGDAYCKSIRSKLVSEITVVDVLGVLRPIWVAKTETASKLRGYIEKVLAAAHAHGQETWAKDRAWHNPARWAGNLDAPLGKPQKLAARGHQAALPFTDVPAFVSRLRAREAVAARALEFLILTAARAGEVFGATWGEIDTATKLWTIPATRMKAGKEHRVPLTDRALSILAEVAKLRTSDKPDIYVFPGGRAGRPLSNMAFKQLLDRMGETGFVPHGFRSSFRDWCGECTPFPREVAEAALAHVVGNAVEQAYRRGDALEKRRALMKAWEAFVEPKAANVVAFVPKGA